MQAAVQLARMQPARLLDQDAAVIEVGADLLPLSLAGHDPDPARPLAERPDLPLQRPELRTIAGERDAAAAPVVDIETLPSDQIFEMLERGARAVQQRCRPALCHTFPRGRSNRA